MEIGENNTGSVTVDGASLDTSSSLGELKAGDQGAVRDLPDEGDRGGTDLAGHSVVTTDIETHDVVGVAVLVVGDIFGGVSDFSATEVLLFAGSIGNNTESGGEVDELAVGGVGVLSGVSRPVSPGVLDVERAVGLLLVDGVVVVGLGDLSLPWLDGHELFALTGLFDLEEVVFWHIAGIVVNATSFLVETHFACINFVEHIRVVTVET